jgi:hypothetical protein
MEIQDQILDATDEQLRERLRRAGPTSPVWAGVVAELQWRAANRLADSVERLSESSRILERYTVKLIRLQWAVRWLTVAFLVFTVCTTIFHRCP